jgi:hypothetical protein
LATALTTLAAVITSSGATTEPREAPERAALVCGH